MHLYSVVDTNPMRLDDLMQVARRQVQDGIPADNRAEAEQIISRLNAQQKPLCPTPTPDAGPRPGRRARADARPAPRPDPGHADRARPVRHGGAGRRGVPVP